MRSQERSRRFENGEGIGYLGGVCSGLSGVLGRRERGLVVCEERLGGFCEVDEGGEIFWLRHCVVCSRRVLEDCMSFSEVKECLQVKSAVCAQENMGKIVWRE